MSSPNKRRKKNDHHASSQPVRGLDFFFGKPKGQEAAKVKTEDANGTANDAGTGSVGNGVGVEGEVLSDEQLARKLQAEWDEQDRIEHASGANAPATIPQTEVDKAPHDELDVDVKPEEQLEDTKDPPINAFSAFGGGKKNTLSLQSAIAEEDSSSYSIPFDQNPLTFSPQAHLPALQKQWKAENGAAPYALLTHCFVLVNTTQSRIKIVDTLVNLLRVLIEGDPSSLLPAVWLATNSISPP